VQRLEGCLGNLPVRLRLVLELRTGVGIDRAYSPAAVAGFLHIGVGQVPGLERRALRALRSAAGTHACAAAVETLPVADLVGAFGQPPFEEAGAIGAVKDLRFASRQRAPSSSSSKHASQNGNALLGINMPPGSGDMWLLVVMIIVGVALVAFLFGDEEWRSRWLHRPPR